MLYENRSHSGQAAVLKRISLLILALTSTVSPGSVSAQEAHPGSAVGTLILAHGGDSIWNAGVLSAARDARTGGPVAVGFLMGPAAAAHRFQDQVVALERAGARDIVIVPLLVSSHSGHYDQIRWLAGESVGLDTVMQHHLHMAGLARAHTGAKLHVARGLDDAPELAAMLSDRSRALADSTTKRALFLIGHGPNSAEDYASWMTNLRTVASDVQARTRFRDVRVDLVRDDAPVAVRAEAVRRIRELITMQAELTNADVVVVPVLVSKSSVGDQKFRRDLAGLPIVYSGEPLLPHPLVARWIERRVHETLAAKAEIR